MPAPASTTEPVVVYTPQGDGSVEIVIDGKHFGWARDLEAARRTVDDFQDCLREAAPALLHSAEVLYADMPPELRAYFDSQ